MKVNLSEAIFWFGCFALVILCSGDPDILDGLIKQANQVECKR